MKIIKTNSDLNESLEKLVEDVESSIEASSDGSKVEADVKVVGDGKETKPATEEDTLIIENALTRMLDRALDDAEFALDEGNLKANCNVLVTGLPGSSKTQTIMNWARAHGCNTYYLDAKNPDLQMLTSGAASIDRTNPDEPTVKTAYSDALAPLDRPRSILFLDELNRQVKEYMRGSLLTLVADRSVAGRGKDGFRHFPNLLFTIAAINPAADTDRGATKLNPAEDRRFYYNVEFHSEKPTTLSYFKGYYDNMIIKYAKAHPDLDPNDIKKINSFVLRQWLGNKIVSNESFKYTTVDEYLAMEGDEGKIMCQSFLTELIDHSRGDLERLKTDINASKLNKNAKDMLTKIIDGIVIPNVDALRKKKSDELGIDLGAGSVTSVETEEKPDDDEITDADFETTDDDEEMETHGSSDGFDHGTSPAEAEGAIKSAISSFFKM